MTPHELIHLLVDVQRNNHQIRTIVTQPTAINLVDRNIEYVGKIADIVSPGLMTRALEDIW